ncbi:ABC transporter substrate-binding protein [Thiovibrio frasassiensis]|uniref:ABC transporter substrate-binding protein n=1 Tax=Thiovibrio frasassiensis TaxID=2984131 RepID=A0A9X4RM33_9BACT|nr:ABC transporter substrate-binding protein [Thiovibrio frasassiensis]MDG4476706.1 ABC transporter substrate-binding protein [Thiovibrio frasassiensis]
MPAITMRLLFLVLVALLAGFNPPASAGTVPATFRDSEGKTVTVSKPYTRIISLYPAHTENLVSLGLDREIIGIEGADEDLPQLKDKKHFSYREDAEKIIGARPDLVLVRPMIERTAPQLLATLRRAGITVVSLQPNTVEEIFDYWRALGVLTGKTRQAEEMVATFQTELAAIRRIISKVPEKKRTKVYFEAIHTKMKTFAQESIASYALQQAGGINVAADASQVRETNIAAYGKEQILAKGAEIEVFLAQLGRMNPVSIETIIQEPGFQAIKAVRNNRVYLVDEHLVARPTLRIIEGIKTIAGLLYPELFPGGGQKKAAADGR